MKSDKGGLGHYVVYVIERRKPSERVFGPIYYDADMRHAAYATKHAALQAAWEFHTEHPENEYRVTGYWDKRPW